MKNYTGEKAPYTKKNLLRQLKELQPEGFVLDPKRQKFIKQEESRRLELTIFSDNSFPHFVQFSGAGGFIAFPQVEEIYNHILKDYPTGWGYGLDSVSINRSMGNNLTSSEKDFLADNFVEDDADFQVVKPILESQVQLALQWFDQFPTLESVHNYAMSLSMQNRAAFIAQPLPMRFAIIKKLINSSDYESYIDSMITHFTNKNRQDIVDYLNALKNYLAENN